MDSGREPRTGTTTPDIARESLPTATHARSESKTGNRHPHIATNRLPTAHGYGSEPKTGNHHPGNRSKSSADCRAIRRAIDRSRRCRASRRAPNDGIDRCRRHHIKTNHKNPKWRSRAGVSAVSPVSCRAMSSIGGQARQAIRSHREVTRSPDAAGSSRSPVSSRIRPYSGSREAVIRSHSEVTRSPDPAQSSKSPWQARPYGGSLS